MRHSDESDILFTTINVKPLGELTLVENDKLNKFKYFYLVFNKDEVILLISDTDYSLLPKDEISLLNTKTDKYYSEKVFEIIGTYMKYNPSDLKRYVSKDKIKVMKITDPKPEKFKENKTFLNEQYKIYNSSLDYMSIDEAIKNINDVFAPMQSLIYTDRFWNGIKAVQSLMTKLDLNWTEVTDETFDTRTWTFRIVFYDNDKEIRHINLDVLAKGLGPVLDLYKPYQINLEVKPGNR